MDNLEIFTKKTDKSIKKIMDKLNLNKFFFRYQMYFKAVLIIQILVFGAFSIATGFWFVYSIILEALGVQAIAAIAAMAILVIWEVVKSKMILELFTSSFQRKLITENNGVKKHHFGAVMFFFMGSVIFSGYGGDKMAIDFASNNTEIQAKTRKKIDNESEKTQEKIDITNTRLNELEALRVSRKNKYLHSSERKLKVEMIERINLLEKKLEKEKKAIKKAQIIALNKDKAKAKRAGHQMTIISLSNEFAIIICIWFQWYYAFRTTRDESFYTLLERSKRPVERAGILSNIIGFQIEPKQTIGTWFENLVYTDLPGHNTLLHGLNTENEASPRKCAYVKCKKHLKKSSPANKKFCSSKCKDNQNNLLKK